MKHKIRFQEEVLLLCLELFKIIRKAGYTTFGTNLKAASLQETGTFLCGFSVNLSGIRKY